MIFLKTESSTIGIINHIEDCKQGLVSFCFTSSPHFLPQTSGERFTLLHSQHTIISSCKGPLFLYFIIFSWILTPIPQLCMQSVLNNYNIMLYIASIFPSLFNMNFNTLVMLLSLLLIHHLWILQNIQSILFTMFYVSILPVIDTLVASNSPLLHYQCSNEYLYRFPCSTEWQL